jgi:hypothetical protein
MFFNSTARDYDVVILGSSRANNHFVTNYSKTRFRKHSITA